MSEAKQGFLVLADISGFTEFVTATAIEHGTAIIAPLLENVIGHFPPPLAVSSIEGDAVFALGEQGAVVPPASLLEVMAAGFAGFREQQLELERDDSCTCEACCNVSRLRLKFIGHYGAFLEQTVGGRTQAAGSDVILAHRFLKNGLAGTEHYALLTRAALETMGVDPADTNLEARTERYEFFGDVECFVHRVEVPPAADGVAEGAPNGPHAISHGREIGVS